MLVFNFTETESSLISGIVYRKELNELTLFFRKYYVPQEIYISFFEEDFTKLLNSNSYGKYYLNFIKKQFKLKKMADRPKTQNIANPNGKRFIQVSLDVTKIDKTMLHVGEKGTYLQCTLLMLPDGEVDKYGNLGMIVQKVPTEMYKKDNQLKGEILGNACEFVPSGGNFEGAPGNETGKLAEKEDFDDLPF